MQMLSILAAHFTTKDRLEAIRARHERKSYRAGYDRAHYELTLWGYLPRPYVPSQYGHKAFMAGWRAAVHQLRSEGKLTD